MERRRNLETEDLLHILLCEHSGVIWHKGTYAAKLSPSPIEITLCALEGGWKGLYTWQ